MLTDTWLLFTHRLRVQLRDPSWLFIGLMQPLLYLVLFGPLLEGLGGMVARDGDPWLLFTPGLLMVIALFGAGFAGFGILFEKRDGVVERQRISPMSRTGLLLGRVTLDVAVVLVQAALLVTVAVAAFGLRASLPGTLLSLALVGLVAAMAASLSYALGLKVDTESSLAAVLNSVSLPLLLLSGVLLPMSLAPDWLYNLSRANPLAYLVDATRDLFAGELASGSVALGAGVTVALAVVAAAAGVRTFQRATA